MREKLKLERTKRNMTQQQLASLVGISRVHYTQIENASHSKNPSFEVALRIKKVLGYQGDDLFLVTNVLDKNT